MEMVWYQLVSARRQVWVIIDSVVNESNVPQIYDSGEVAFSANLLALLTSGHGIRHDAGRVRTALTLSV